MSKLCYFIFFFFLQKLPFQCNVLRIEVDCTASGSWVEIDAIKISSTKFNFGKQKMNQVIDPLCIIFGKDLGKLCSNLPLEYDHNKDIQCQGQG